jgi:hypothetical protein
LNNVQLLGMGARFHLLIFSVMKKWGKVREGASMHRKVSLSLFNQSLIFHIQWTKSQMVWIFRFLVL